ncbi:MAG: hypothetical protein NTX55_00890, partial [Candidatus Parcubacteria bacterium]|nr:hypothetical protein [Candidatus Parcubacteria bacterium]
IIIWSLTIMQLFQQMSPNLLLKEKNNNNANDAKSYANDTKQFSQDSHSVRNFSIMLSDEALEDDLEIEEDIDNLPI